MLGISNRGDEKKRRFCVGLNITKETNSFEKISCKKSTIEILREEVYPFSNEYSLYVEGNVERNINIQVDTYDCVSDIFKPKTWFRCNEKFLGSEIITIRPHLFFRTNQNGSDVPVRSFSMNGDRFKLLAGYTKTEKI